ncbi:MAG: DUF2188 domain-containing protein [Anaerolineales bacterium]|nr:DUF2188 domain-containing protein [Anaerolineales bacterium]
MGVVRREGAPRDSFHLGIQAEAVRRGRTIARRERVELLVHGEDDAIRERDSYGDDPMPPRDAPR